MASLTINLDNPTVSNLRSSVYQQIVSQFQADWATQLHVDQMFVLIDGMLPFEACLYYQVLPLFLEGNRLHLGMVSPDDTAASDYVRRIIAYLNYSLVPQSISSEALRVVLTAYLNHAGHQQPVDPQDAVSYGHHRHSARSKAEHHDPTERMTLIVDSPEDLDAEDHPAANFHEATPPPAIESFSSADVAQAELEPIELVELGVNLDAVPSKAQTQKSLSTRFNTEATASPAIDSLQTTAQASLAGQPLPVLQLEAEHLSSPVEVLATLPAPALLQELLARVLLGGIGRLYFEAYPQHGRVVWSQNGVLQSVLDRLPLPLFHDVLHQLKRMAAVSPEVTQQTQQTEIEYLYDRSCVLLRFRFMAGQHGEEATIQVLRGAALKFYQQQQMSKLEKDAMNIAKQLQNKLNEIRMRAYADPNLLDAKFDMLPKLGSLLQSIEAQLDELGIDHAQQ